MRKLLFSSTLLLLITFSLSAQDQATLPTDEVATSNASDVLNMPSKWHKINPDKKVDFLFSAVERGDIVLAQEMIQDVSMPYYQHDKQGETLLTLAIKMGNYEMVDWLCEDAVINLKNEDGETPLTVALKTQQAGVIARVLERAKADLPNDADETPLMLAIRYNYGPAMVRSLLALGANPNRQSNGISPLSQAVTQEQVNLAALLVRHGADPSHPNADGIIPLYQAVEADHAVLAGVLLHRSEQAGDDANWQTPMGETLTNMAIAQENTTLLRVLVDKGADVNAVDYLENTPLHLAAERGMADAVDILLSYGANVDAINIMGTTPIMEAAQRGYNGIANTLAQAGANPDMRDYSGIAASDYGSYEYSDPYLQQQVDLLMQDTTNE